MDITGLIRNPDKVREALSKKSDKSVVCLKDIHITFPQVFIQDNLVDLGDKPAVTAIFAIVVDDKYYAVSNALAKMTLTPDETSTYTEDGDVYVKYTFYAGGTLTENTALVKENTLTYYTYKTVLSKGYVPWYFEVKDKVNLFNSALRHANVNIGCDRVIPSIYTALLTRSPNDVTKHWRHTVKTQEEFDTVRPVFVGSSNVSIAIEGTLPNMGGSYASEGFVGALTKPTMESDPLQDILTGKFKGVKDE